MRLAEETLGWLRNSGFRVRRTSAENLYATVLFVNETTHVKVTWDLHDRALDVLLGPVAGADFPDGAQLPDGTHAQFPLWLLLWVRTTDEARARLLATCNDESEAGLRTVLEANSRALEEVASDVLLGDFSIWPRAALADSARIEANMAGRPWGTPP